MRTLTLMEARAAFLFENQRDNEKDLEITIKRTATEGKLQLRCYRKSPLKGMAIEGLTFHNSELFHGNGTPLNINTTYSNTITFFF